MVTLRWMDDNKRILLYEFPQEWTWADFWAATENLATEYSDIDFGLVDVIMDARNIRKVPPNPLENIRRARQQTTARGLLVIVTDHIYLEALIRMSQLIMPHHLPIERRSTMDEALKAIHAYRNSKSSISS